MTLYIQPIVEGQTEQKCLEKILQRIWRELLAQESRLQVIEPFRKQRDRLLNPNHPDLEAAVRMASHRLQSKRQLGSDSKSLILILIDAEDDCPVTMGQNILPRASKALPQAFELSCVIAHRMLENWFVAGSSTLGGINGLPTTLPVPSSFEKIRGKNWLDNQIRSVTPSQKYKETVDSYSFASEMNIQDCQTHSRSFRKLCKELAARISSPITVSGNQESQVHPGEIS